MKSTSAAADTPIFLDETPEAFEGSDQVPNFTEAIASLRSSGYAILESGIAETDLDAARADTTSMIKGARVADGWKRSDAIRRIAEHEPFLRLLSTAYGRRAFPFQTLNFEFGSQQPAHADSYHFNSKPEGFMCGIWVALEDVSPDAGPIYYYPGSQQLRSTLRVELPGAQTYAEYETHVLNLMRLHGFEPQHALLKKGQALIWAANLVHGGAKRNRTDVTRFSQVTHYYFDGCAYFTPLEYDLARAQHSLREPYDISSNRFVSSDPSLLSGHTDSYKATLRRISYAKAKIGRDLRRWFNMNG